MKNMFGVQLYSFRREIYYDGLEPVLTKIKAAGFDNVEFAGFYNYSPDKAVELLKKYGLKAVSAHISLEDIEKSLEYVTKLQLKYVVIPYTLPETLENNFVELVGQVKAAKKIADENGFELLYHNHNQEYANGTDKVFDLINAVDGLKSQLDIFWAVAGGHNPTELMKKYGDKLGCLHIKEMDNRVTDDFVAYPNAIVGEGKSNTEQVFALAKEMGINLFILECEGFPCDYGEYLTRSLVNMKKFAK